MGIGDFLSKLFKHKTLDLEAKLRPTLDCSYGGSGEVEIERWSDGTFRGKVSIKHSGIESGKSLDVYCNGRCICKFPVTGGFAKYYLLPAELERLAEVKIGDSADFRMADVVLYSGTFHRD